MIQCSFDWWVELCGVRDKKNRDLNFLRSHA
jgi:hypothetical protein